KPFHTPASFLFIVMGRAVSAPEVWMNILTILSPASADRSMPILYGALPNSYPFDTDVSLMYELGMYGLPSACCKEKLALFPKSNPLYARSALDADSQYGSVAIITQWRPISGSWVYLIAASTKMAAPPSGVVARRSRNWMNSSVLDGICSIVTVFEPPRFLGNLICAWMTDERLNESINKASTFFIIIVC